jgi:signal transduction histidine kinase
MQHHVDTARSVDLSAAAHESTSTNARAAFEASPLPTILVDGDFRLVGANRAGRALFEGIDLFQRHVGGLFAYPGPSEIDAAIGRVRPGGPPVMVDVEWTGIDGETHHGRLVLGALDRSNCQASVIGVVESDRAREVAELTQEAASRDETVACAGHEIRNVFFAVSGHADLLRRRSTQLTAEDVARTGAQLVALMQRSEVLLTDFIEARRPECSGVEPVDLTLALAGAFAMCPPDEAVVAVPDGVSVLASPGRIEQVVTNLVKNARRHGGEGATVSVTVTADPHTVALAVSDDGPGVPEWAVERIFEPFFQADHRSRVGSGLGLAIVKRLVESFGGTIRYEPNEPGGARFLVTFRRALSPAFRHSGTSGTP